MSAPGIEGMARDMAREILDDDLLEVEVASPHCGKGCRAPDAWVTDFSSRGLDFLERWLQRAYEAGRKAA